MTTTDPTSTTTRTTRCSANTLLYPDGQRRCWRHATDADRALVTALDARADARGIPIVEDSPFLSPLNRAWPYGPNVDVPARAAMLDWAEAYDLRLTDYDRCLHWLRAGRCTADHCLDHVAGWRDHVTGWSGPGGVRVLVSQPYSLGSDDAATLAELGAEPGLTVQITGTGWYGHGTVFIAVWHPDSPRL